MTSEFQERFFFDDAVSALRYGQKIAVATDCRVQVTINASGYVLNHQNGCTGSTYTQTVVHPGTGVDGYSSSPPGGVSVSSTVSPILFDPLGRALNSGGSVTNATVTIASRLINVVGETGSILTP